MKECYFRLHYGTQILQLYPILTQVRGFLGRQWDSVRNGWLILYESYMDSYTKGNRIIRDRMRKVKVNEEETLEDIVYADEIERERTEEEMEAANKLKRAIELIKEKEEKEKREAEEKKVRKGLMGILR